MSYPKGYDYQLKQKPDKGKSKGRLVNGLLASSSLAPFDLLFYIHCYHFVLMNGNGLCMPCLGFEKQNFNKTNTDEKRTELKKQR